MTLWFGVGGFVIVALVFVLVPLFRQKSAPAGRHDAIRWPTAGVLGVLPALTVGLYLYLGAPAIIEEQALIRAHSNYDVDGMVRALEDKLKAAPNDPEGWYALGRAYIAFMRYADAEEALGKAVVQAPKDARILAQYAEAMALRMDTLDGRPMELILEALEIDHEETKALELAGLSAFQKENWAESLHYWRRLLRLLPKDTEQHETIARATHIAETRLQERLGGSGVTLPRPAAQPKQAPH